MIKVHSRMLPGVSFWLLLGLPTRILANNGTWNGVRMVRPSGAWAQMVGHFPPDWFVSGNRRCSEPRPMVQNCSPDTDISSLVGRYSLGQVCVFPPAFFHRLL